MAYKLDISDIVRHHFKTIVNDNTRKPDGRDYFFFLILPLLIAIGLPLLGVYISSNLIESIIGGLSIYVGLSLNLVVLLFEIAQKKETSEFKKTFAKDLIANVSFSIILSLVTIISVVLTLIECPICNQNCTYKPILHGIAYFFLTEMFVLIILLVKNMYFQIIEQID
jgi:Na+-translocating ferredoxin:NAD+ oxidoreductase RnfA subunit